MERETTPATLLADPVQDRANWGLLVSCDRCRLSTVHQLGRLNLPPATRIIDVIARLRCRRCGRKADRVTTSPPGRTGGGHYLAEYKLLDGPDAREPPL